MKTGDDSPGQQPLLEPEPAPVDLEHSSDHAAPLVEGSSTENTTVRRPLFGVTARRALVTLVVMFCSLLPFQQSSYVLVQPGPVFPVELVAGDSSTPAVPEGTWSFTTIAVKRLNWVELMVEKVRNPGDIFPSNGRAIASSASAQMEASKQTAASVAEFLLYNLTTPTGWFITDVFDGSAAERYGLRVNDRIEQVNGLPLRSVVELRILLRAGPVTLTVNRDGQSNDVVVDSRGDRYLGVELAPIGAPQMVDGDAIRTEDVGGGSAGLMFTLALLDHNSDGDLSGGRRIAGTGTMNPDGTVGPIVGAAYKFAAAEAAGADVFFVPTRLRDELPDTSSTEIVPVADIADAVTWLCENGGRSPQLCGR